MPSLREFQGRFARALLDNAAPAEDLRGIIAGRGLAPARRVQVYRNNMRASLAAALADTYPAVAALVGEAFFRMLAYRYIAHAPPVRGNLLDFGADFAQFAGRLPETRSLPWLEDMGRLEWAYHLVFHAAEKPAIVPEALTDVDPELHGELVFELHPASQPVDSKYPLVAIWNLAISGDSPDVDLDQGPEYLLVARRNLEIEFQKLDPAGYAFVTAMAHGRALAACIEAACSVDAEFDAAAGLHREFSRGNIVGYRIDPASATAAARRDA